MSEIFESDRCQASIETTTRSTRKRQTAEDSITILTSKGPLLTKMIWWEPRPTAEDDSAGRWNIVPYGNAKSFRISERAVGNIEELADVLAEIEQDPRSCVVRGKPAEGIDREHAYRRVHPRTAKDGTIEPATLCAAGHHWVPLDIDSLSCPEGIDPVRQPDQTVEHVVGHLPEEFHGVTCWWAFTSGQQVKPGIRIRLFFWSDRPLEDWQLKTWLGKRIQQDGIPQTKWKQRYPVDLAIFAAAQPIYVATPHFFGYRPDPVPVRSGVWRGDRDSITPPEITPKITSNPGNTRKIIPAPETTPKNTSVIAFETPTPRLVGYEIRGYEAHRARIGDHEGGDAFHGPIKAAVAAYIARHGSSVDTGWMRADLERAIREAPRDLSAHNDGYVAFRIRDLDTLITAISELQKAKEAGRQQFADCKPTYPPKATTTSPRTSG
jgi:hypothetical protein